jgi:cytochrome o ubiquinol oxidase subunit III
MEVAVQREDYSKTILGFWIYIMSDCLLFGSFFATYAVLRNSTFGGPSLYELFNPAYSLAQTLILLTSSFTCGPALLSAVRGHKRAVVGWFGITFLLGIAFLVMEITEFSRFVLQGASWRRSAFLSGFFTLVGAHGAHVTFGLLWMAILMGQVWSRGLTAESFKRISCLRLFWHFLDIVWIFIFTVVYLMGVV